jgi:Cu2+-exporting ATPase
MQTAIEQRVCIHCGTAFQPTAHRPDFCCAGCQCVHDLIAKNGLSQFYDLQEGDVPPVQSLVFQKRDYAWLEDLARDSAGTLMLDVQGISCIGCAWLIEKLFSRKPGALVIHVDPALGQLALRWQPGVFNTVSFAQELQSFGYLVGPPGKSAVPANRALNLRLGLCAALTMNTMLFTLPRYLGMESDFEFAPLFDRLTLLLGTLSFLIGGSYFFIRSWRSLRQRILHIDLPISLGLIAAYAGSVVAWTRGAHAFVYFDFVSTFTFLMLAGRWLQQKAVERNRHRLLASHGEMPPVELAETGEKLPVAELAPGAKFLVAPGQAIPVRSRLDSAAATLGLEWINGESEATTAGRGRIVSSGAINCGQRAIELEALEAWPHSLLFRLLKSVPGGPHRHTALERFIRGYIVVVLVVGGAGFLGWWLATGDLLRALQVLISVLVVSCPCASGVALPLADDLAAGALRQIGVFVRHASLWTRLGQVKKILFDKTGTLTLETLALRNPEALAALHPEEKRVLLALVNHNLHPVSCCLREALLAEGVGEMHTPAPEEHIGLGLELRLDHDLWRLGRDGWAGEGHGDGLFSRNGVVLAEFRFGDDLRSDAAEEVHALERRGCEVFILSGDRRAKVKALSRRLNLRARHCFAEMTPAGKAEWVAAHDAHDTLLIGDGANDSLAFNAAWTTGTPAVDRGLLENKADFYFLGRNLGGIRALLETADLRRRVVRHVLGFAIAYNTGAIAFCLTGRMSPLLAAVLMPASSLVSLAIVIAGFGGRRRGRSSRR